MCRKAGPTEPVFWKHPSSECSRCKSLWVEWPRPRPGWLSGAGPPSGARPPPWPVSTEKRTQTAAVSGRGGVRGAHRCQQPRVLPRHSLAQGVTPSSGTRHHSVSSHALGGWSGGGDAMASSLCPQDPREGRCLRHSSGTLVPPVTFQGALRLILPPDILRGRHEDVSTEGQ